MCFSQEERHKICNLCLWMREDGFAKEISHRRVLVDPEPKVKYNQVYLDKLNPPRPDPQNIHECKVDKEEVPNKYFEEVFEPQVEI